MEYDAYRIEKRIGSFLKEVSSVRGGISDADHFRSGKPKKLSKVIQGLGQQLQSLEVELEMTEVPNYYTNFFDGIANEVVKRNVEEPYDYHWEIIGQLCDVIKKLESNKTGEKED